MSIVKRGNSKYWYIHFQLNGVTYIRSSKTTNKKAAVQMEAEWRTQLHANLFLGRKERIQLGQAMAQFCDSRKNTPSYQGLMSCANVVARHFSVTKYIDELTSHELERFKQIRTSAGISNQTIKHNLNLIRGSCEFARKMGYQVGVIEFPQVKIIKPPVRFMSEEEETHLLTCLDPAREGRGLSPFVERSEEMQQMLQDAYDLTILLLDVGGRYSELANIEWARIDMDTRIIHLWRSKVSNGSVLYMTDRVYYMLLKRKRNGPHVFQNRKGLARGYSTQSIRKAIRRAGLESCHVHTFRHTLATRLLQNGLSLYEVKEILGHSKIETTMIYAHLELSQTSMKARDAINRINSRIG
ncbi:tyrosine-type recombinase/integrase [Herminiimonas arsenitoxidans]|uniref:tyrosine-type recombinase/integrase n=1 Tax=Herminiimonas arsenitoxidans TaxID=1809410 RepID=UPI000970DE78|nr:site-specific integrase [Herminiimonas arsenitoxidans]